MTTPVLIPAHNEADYITNTLQRLPQDKVTPIVLANGCTDKTAEIAESFGVTVLVEERQGKFPAVQQALRYLYDKSVALEPILMIDADSAPDFPRKWSDTMTYPMTGAESAVVTGPIRFTEGEMIMNIYRSARLYAKFAQVKLGRIATLPYGINMGIKLGNRNMLDAVLDLPHYWPGEDRALADTIEDHEGVFFQRLHPFAAVHSSSRSHMPFRERIAMDREVAKNMNLESYVARGAAGSIPYERS